MFRVFAYCRVSTLDQTTENQVQEITAAGFVNIETHRWITEQVSGSVAASERPAFMRLLDRLERGDVLVVTKLDRLGRNAMDVRKTVEDLDQKGIRVHCLALGGMDLTSPAGKMTMQVIASVAEFERDLLIERTQAGLERAKKEGKKLGRPSSLTEKQKWEAMNLLHGGNSINAVARKFRTSRQTILRVKNSHDQTFPP